MTYSQVFYLIVSFLCFLCLAGMVNAQVFVSDIQLTMGLVLIGIMVVCAVGYNGAAARYKAEKAAKEAESTRR